MDQSNQIETRNLTDELLDAFYGSKRITTTAPMRAAVERVTQVMMAKLRTYRHHPDPGDPNADIMHWTQFEPYMLDAFAAKHGMHSHRP